MSHLRGIGILHKKKTKQKASSFTIKGKFSIFDQFWLLIPSQKDPKIKKIGKKKGHEKKKKRKLDNSRHDDDCCCVGKDCKEERDKIWN